MGRSALYPLIGWNSELNMYNKILLYTAVLRPILTYGSPVWGYAADANIKILEVAQNSIIRNIVKANRYTKNSLIYKDIKVLPLKNNHASLPPPINKSGYSHQSRPFHIRPHLQNSIWDGGTLRVQFPSDDQRPATKWVGLVSTNDSEHCFDKRSARLCIM
ncbi:hypothetical protein TNCV_4805771 [Trichonephila clavipes]|nr:hypothetical protein TNCV_4805771 [Trichonephila clavipes]